MREEREKEREVHGRCVSRQTELPIMSLIAPSLQLVTKKKQHYGFSEAQISCSMPQDLTYDEGLDNFRLNLFALPL